MSQHAFQLTQPDRAPDGDVSNQSSRSTDTDARLSEIRALSPLRESAAHLPLWLECASLGGVLLLLLANFALLNLDLGARGNLTATLTVSALIGATISAGLGRVRRPSALGVIVVGLVALLLAWFAFAAAGDSLEVQPTRRTFAVIPS